MYGSLYLGCMSGSFGNWTCPSGLTKKPPQKALQGGGGVGSSLSDLAYLKQQAQNLHSGMTNPHNQLSKTTAVNKPEFLEARSVKDSMEQQFYYINAP